MSLGISIELGLHVISNPSQRKEGTEAAGLGHSDCADQDSPANGNIDDDDDDDFLTAEEDEEDQSESDESSVDEERDYPYLNPPAHGHPDDGEERPPFVLIEPDAYFADDRDNATTASCEMRDLGGTFKVTFCTVRPPLVSYMCVHATAYDHTEFAVEPHIIAAETNGGLVLLRFVIGRHPSDMMSTAARQYFVYDAGGPSLKHLPHPRFHVFNEHSVAIVRDCNKRSQHTSNDHDCSNCDYVLAAQLRGFGFVKSSELCLYRSDTEAWSKVPVVIKNKSYPSHITSKTLTIGGDKGTVAWVDLWNNILLCDVLDERPVLRTVKLPPPIMPARAAVGYGHPGSVRDIALVGSFIRFVQLQPLPVKQGTPGESSSIFYTWKVAVWSIKAAGTSSSKDWQMDHLLSSTEIPESSLPKLRVGDDVAQPTLSTLHIGLPNLSLLDDGIVYFLTKIDYRDNSHVAWVLAVDMRNRIVQNVSEFSSRRTVGLAQGYSASRISKYLKG